MDPAYFEKRDVHRPNGEPVDKPKTPVTGRLGYAAMTIVVPIITASAILLGTASAVVNLATLRLSPALEKFTQTCFIYGSKALAAEADLFQAVISGSQSKNNPIRVAGINPKRGIVPRHTTMKLQSKVVNLTEGKPVLSVDRQIYARAVSLFGLATCLFPRLADAAMVVPLLVACATMHAVKAVAKKRFKDKPEADEKLKKIDDATNATARKFYDSLLFTAAIHDVYFFAANFLLPKQHSLSQMEQK